MMITIVVLLLMVSIGSGLVSVYWFQKQLDELEIITLHNKNQLVTLTANQSGDHMKILTLYKRLEDEKVI